LSDVLCKTQSGKAAFEDSGVLSLLIDMALQIAENSTSIMGFSNSQILSERTASIVFLVDIWKFKPYFIQSRQNENRMMEAIL
jgi:hypothetical protein